VDLHHTRRSEPFGFQPTTQLLSFTHQSHRNDDYDVLENKNNPEITFETAFSPLQNVAPLVETLSAIIASP